MECFGMSNIEINAVTKQYKKNIKGLDNVSFSIGTGVFGLLGHNGAGKTTLMRLITTILRPTQGTIKVLGGDTMKNGDSVRHNIGYLPQELTMYNSLSAFDFVAYVARLKGITDDKAVIQMLENVGMSEYKKRKIGQLSGGMKRRVGIAQALVGNPRIVIVDEPTAGLDPEERVRFRGILSQYAKTDRTIVLSTHIVEDIYQLCEQVAVLREGKLFYNGSTNTLLDTVKGKVKIIDISSEQEIANLQNQTVILSIAYTNDGIKVRIMDETERFKQSPVQETLEDAYVYCMGGKSNA
jgi:ABC-2 type transport system ATP-binding protein